LKSETRADYGVCNRTEVIGELRLRGKLGPFGRGGEWKRGWNRRPGRVPDKLRPFCTTDYRDLGVS
jgi:hypothetical protein